MKRQRRKALESQEGQELALRQLSRFEQVLNALQSEGSRLLPRHINQIKALTDKDQSQVDVGYIKTVVFPEDNFFDIPQPLSTISFSRFSHKDEIIINTGLHGQGMLLWFPRCTSGPSLMLYYPTEVQVNMKIPAPATTFQTLPNNGAAKFVMPDDAQANIRYGFSYDYQEYFTSALLVGASLQLQYIGTMDAEAGIVVGGQLYDIPMDQVDTQAIENSSWLTKGRPSEGFRFIHLPVDQEDFQYYQIGTQTVQTTTGPQKFTKTMNQGGAQSAGQGDLSYAVGKYLDFGGATQGSNDNIYLYHQSANCVALYWTGMKKDEQWLRLDMIRRFNGTPYAKYRDIVDIIKPQKSFDSKKTIDAVCQLSINSPIGGQTLKEMDKIVDQLQETLPNIGYLQENGGLKRVSTMQQLANQLDIQNTQDKQLSGFVSSGNQRAYPF